MIISNDKVVSLSYELRVNNEIVDNAVSEHPLVFIYGRGQLLPLFEEKINGLKVGDTFEFMVSCDEGYGQVNEMAVVELPKDIFRIDGEIPADLLEVGRSLPRYPGRRTPRRDRSSPPPESAALPVSFAPGGRTLADPTFWSAIRRRD